jgi:transposase-like protein
MRKLLKKQGFAPKILVTDKLRPYAAAVRHLQLTCRHEQGLRGNNRAENSHQPVRLWRQVNTGPPKPLGRMTSAISCDLSQEVQPDIRPAAGCLPA